MIKINNMMKKIFVLVLFLVLGKMWGYAQYPIQQFIGADSALVTSKGGLQGRLINWSYSDTGAANNQRIKAYPGAQIVTINGGLNLWVRNATATAWLPIALGSGNNIYTIDGTLLGNRELKGAGFKLTFDSLSKFAVNTSDSILFNTPQFNVKNLFGDLSVEGTASGGAASSSLTLKTDSDGSWTFKTGTVGFDVGDLRFYDNVNGGGNARMIIKASGKVGIGTEIPDSLLSVNGGVYVGGGIRAPGLPQASGTKALRIDASGNLSYADTLIDAGGTVTSIATNNGSGITGGTITTTGTLAIDTTLISTRLWRQKGVDSLQANINGKLNISDTSSMLTDYFRINGLGLNRAGQTVLADTLLLSTRAWRQKGIDSVAALINNNVSGISGYVSKFSGTNTLDTSQIYQNDGRVGIGTTSPTQKLSINGKIALNTSGQNVLISSRYPSGAVGKNIFIGGGGESAIYSGGAFDATWNTSLGVDAFLSATTGFQNTAIGYQALKDNTEGNNNVAIGASSIRANISGDQNAAVGVNSLSTLTTGSNNTAIGQEAGSYTSGSPVQNTGSNNSVYLGYYTRSSTNSNTNEIVIGAQADGNGSNSVTLGNTSITKTILRANVGVGTTAPDSALTVVNGAYFQRGVRASGLPTAVGAKALRIDASGTISIADTLVDAGGTVTSVATNTGTGITGGTITTSGTLAIDTLLISTRAWRQKGIDSVAALLPAAISGTTNYIPKFTSSSAIGNSIMNESGSNINVAGSITTGFFLTNAANGTGGQEAIRINNNNGYIGFFNAANTTRSAYIQGNTTDLTLTTSLSTPIIFGIANAEQMRLTSTGLGIGTSSPASKLQVNGSGANTILESGSASDARIEFKRNGTRIGLLNWDSGLLGVQLDGSNYFYVSTGGSERMRLDASGNLGLGVTPSAFSGVVGLQLPSFGVIAYSSSGHLTSNAYFNSGWKYITGAGAAMYNHSGNEHQWQIAPSGTAGNAISFTQAMTLDASGNLGIGTTMPSAILHTSSSTGTVRFASSTDNDAGRIVLMEAGLDAWSIDGDKANGQFIIRDEYNSATRLVIGNTGNVGIGTTSPTSLLHLYKSGATSQVTIEGAGASNPVLYLKNPSGYTAYIQYNTTGGAGLSIYDVTANTDRMVINSSGNVGIGTTSPNQKLHVAGIAKVGPATPSGTGVATLILSNDFDNDNAITHTSDKAIAFLNNGTERMRITSGGNVGIGTTSPSEKLEVNGNIKTAAPTGGTAKPWKLGERVATGVTLDSGQYIRVEIDGVTYYLATVTIN